MVASFPGSNAGIFLMLMNASRPCKAVRTYAATNDGPTSWNALASFALASQRSSRLMKLFKCQNCGQIHARLMSSRGGYPTERRALAGRRVRQGLGEAADARRRRLLRPSPKSRALRQAGFRFVHLRGLPSTSVRGRTNRRRRAAGQ
jgi:hypothetical protein